MTVSAFVAPHLIEQQVRFLPELRFEPRRFASDYLIMLNRLTSWKNSPYGERLRKYGRVVYTVAADGVPLCEVIQHEPEKHNAVRLSARE